MNNLNIRFCQRNPRIPFGDRFDSILALTHCSVTRGVDIAAFSSFLLENGRERNDAKMSQTEKSSELIHFHFELENIGAIPVAFYEEEKEENPSTSRQRRKNSSPHTHKWEGFPYPSPMPPNSNVIMYTNP